VSRKLSELERDRAERRKVRKRTKAASQTTDAASAAAPNAAASSSVLAGGDVEMSAPGEDAEGEKGKPGAVLEEESVYRAKEKEELEKLVSPELKNDTGCSVSGLYDLVGTLFRLWSASGRG
jgi:ubiquitin carboxyl-terminal hydrolase 14